MTGNVSNRQDAVNPRRGRRGSRTPEGDAMSELVIHVFRLDGLLTAAGDALAEPAGQTTARWRVLAAVEHGAMTVPQIARAWGFARQSVQRVTNALARDGCAVYEAKPAHRRRQLVRLK